MSAIEDNPSCELSGGGPVTADHRELKPNGQQKGYIVLTAAERARGFVRPLRFAYRHVGPPPAANLRDLTAEERELYDQYGYVKYEQYPKSASCVVGRYWTQAMLDAATKGGCGTLTTMSRDIAETYASAPNFYGGTFCCGCGKHLPVGEQGEFVWDGTEERVGT